MWRRIAHFVLHNRLSLLIGILALTAFWGYMAIFYLHVNHKFGDMIPGKDSSMIVYNNLKSEFGEDGMVMVIGVKDKNLYQLKKFNAWYELGQEIKKVEGVDSVFSVAHMYNIVKDDSLKKFNLKPVSPKGARSQKHADSIREIIHSLPFYNGKLYNEKTGASLMMVFIDPKKFNSENRGTTVDEIVNITDKYQDIFPEIHHSGMPYIRTVLFDTLRGEMRLFLGLSALMSLLIIYIFFRSIRIVLICTVQIAIGIVWSFGTMATLGYEVSSLMALIPPLITVIAVPNCIYLLNRFQQEYMKCENKIKAIYNVIQKIGIATFLTNATTAAGFGTFVFTTSEKMIEFGIVAFINVFALFITSIIIIPVILSYVSPPSVKQTKHLERKWVGVVIQLLINLATKRAILVYGTMIVVTVVGIIGINMMKTEGQITGDLSPESKVLKDLRFIEDNFGGTIPFEIVIDTKKKGQLRQNKTLEKIEAFQVALSKIDHLSASISLVDATKFLNQAFYGGDPEQYVIPTKRDQVYLQKYFEKNPNNKSKKQVNALKGFRDSAEIKTRITMQAADLGTFEIEALQEKVSYIADTTFNPEKEKISSLYKNIISSGIKDSEKDKLLAELYDLNGRIKYALEDHYTTEDTSLIAKIDADENNFNLIHRKKDFNAQLKKAISDCSYKVYITGTSVVFAKGAHYMVDNLLSSIIYAIISISLLMALLFRSFRMVLITMVPNIFPLIITAAIMGFFGVPIKPSTILIFSIALGISVDDAIHYLAKYRQELKGGMTVKEAAIESIRESGVSMIYTSIILFAGFSVFIFSDFGGTKALGILLSITLGVAMVCNLVILPTLLMTLNKFVNIKAMKEPYLDIFDEEIDIELSELEIKKIEGTADKTDS
jgi:predicted RND superfamily exporter protein